MLNKRVSIGKGGEYHFAGGQDNVEDGMMRR